MADQSLTVIDRTQKFLDQQRDRLTQWILPSSGASADALIRHALHELQTNAAIQQCTPSSVYLALLACAVTGLVPGKMRGLAFLIPFKNKKRIVDNGIGKEIETQEATFVVGWRGYKAMGFRAGVDMVSDVVHEHDEFDFDKGTNKFITHKPSRRGRGQIIGAYAYAKMPRGGLEIEWLDLDQLGAIEQFAIAKNGGVAPAWTGPFKDQMQRKSALRRLGKQIEMGEDFIRADLLDPEEGSSSAVAALDMITGGDASRALGSRMAEDVAFGALPEKASVSVAVPADPAQAAKVTSVPARARNAAPVPSAPSPTSAPTAKLDAATSAARAKNANSPPSASAVGPTSPPPSATPEATGAPSPAISTTSGSPSKEDAEPSRSASSDARPSDDESGRAFDESFGEDPEDAAPAPQEKTIDGFHQWLASCKSKRDVDAGKREWLEWSTQFPRKDPRIIEMQDAFAKRKAGLPA